MGKQHRLLIILQYIAFILYLYIFNIYTVPRNGIGRRAGPPDPFMEMERMKRMMLGLQEQLALADDTIRKLKGGQELQNGVMVGGKFENVSHGGIRPSQIVEQYGHLYSQGRLNAMDDLDQIAGLSKYGKHTEMKQKILYGIMVVSRKLFYFVMLANVILYSIISTCVKNLGLHKNEKI